MKFVIYEVWTRSRVVEAENEVAALADNEPLSRGDDLSLCNWHAVALPEEPTQSRSQMKRLVAQRAPRPHIRRELIAKVHDDLLRITIADKEA